MNTLKKLLFLAIVLSLTASFRSAAHAQALSDISYYWVTPRPEDQLNRPDESFVIAVDAAQAGQIEAIRARGHLPGFSGRLALGSGNYNRNYSAPDQPLWNWHVASTNQIYDLSDSYFIACQCPDLIANPSDIARDPAEWIHLNGDRYTPIGYRIQGRIEPGSRTAMANVSNRGLAGSGERTLIAGFIVTGGEPRNVVVRALGPSLRAQGLQQAADNPKLGVYLEGAIVAENSDWQNDARASFLSTAYPRLRPPDDKEAALFLTLLPGAYTVHAGNEDGSEKVILLEVYDVDPAAPR